MLLLIPSVTSYQFKKKKKKRYREGLGNKKRFLWEQGVYF